MQKRLTALDALRGFTVAAMIMVNFPGNDEFFFHTLRHSKWNALSFTDHVAPFFLFIIVISIYFSYSDKSSNEKPTLYKKFIWHALKIFLIGMFLNLMPTFDFLDIRRSGTLHRIAVVFLICSIISLHTNRKQQLVMFGVNAISSYVLGDLLALLFHSMKVKGSTLNMDIFNYLTSVGMIPELVSWMYALLFISIVSLPCWMLYKKGVFIKV
jgi:predicted acyltransferase